MQDLDIRMILTGCGRCFMVKTSQQTAGRYEMVTAKFYSAARVLCMLAIATISTAQTLTVEPPRGTVVPRGTVDLVISGKPLTPKTGQEIVAIARETKFYPDGKLIWKPNDKQTIEYVPTEFGTRDPIVQGLVDGVLLYKFTVTGSPSGRGFAPGTYYVWLEFIEGRWQAVTVNSAATIQCGVLGVEVTQTIARGEEHPHDKPKIAIHKHGSLGVAARMGWSTYSTAWVPVGQYGCKRTTFCNPV
jgi:hypothetical protein